MAPQRDSAARAARPADAAARGGPSHADHLPATDGEPSTQRSPAAVQRFSPEAAHLTEQQLSELWRGRRFPPGALVTRHGVPVNVIFQGRPGRGAGPDFRGATISGPSGLPLHGDIELHVRSSSFRAHGHEVDRAYANIILHVVFDDDTGADTPLYGGASAPVVALAPWVAHRAGELERWLAQPLLWREPCHDAAMRLGVARVEATLESEGDRRFGGKVARALDTVRAAGLDQALYEGLLEALGYGGNAPPMLALARLLPWGQLKREGVRLPGAADPRAHDASSGSLRRDNPRAPALGAAALAVLPDSHPGSDPLSFEALLLGAAGLLPSQRGHSGAPEPYVLTLERRFRNAGMPSLPPGLWKLWGVRPENAPARRVAAAAALLSRLGDPVGLLSVLDATTVNEAVAPLLIGARGYWLLHHDVGAGPVRLPSGLIGRSRALEIVVNVILPVAAASGDPQLAEKAQALYARLPRPSIYGVTRFIEQALSSEGLRVGVNARRAQGLLALHRDWCSQNGCGRCPLS